MAEKTTQNYQALIRRIKKKTTYLFFTEGQTGHGSDTKRPCSKTGFRGTPLLPALCKQPFCMLGLSKHSIVHGTMTGSAPSQRPTLPCSRVFFLNTVHESFKILSSTSSMPLSLGLFHLARQHFPDGTATWTRSPLLHLGDRQDTRGQAKGAEAQAQLERGRVGQGDRGCKEEAPVRRTPEERREGGQDTRGRRGSSSTHRQGS